MIPATFINYASDILGETGQGLSGSKIAGHLSAYAIDFNVDIPYPEYPFPTELPNKRTALRENLKAFPPDKQFIIIKDLCELPHFSDNKDAKELKFRLLSRYGNYAQDNPKEDVNESLIEETQHWLNDYPDSLKLYNEALEKHANKIHQRNLLDDLRLSLETLLKQILENNKSMENQLGDLGTFIAEREGSKELTNMFVKLIDYFSKYQNSYVKHNDSVNENEVEIIMELASSFMKFLIRMK